MGKTRNTGKKLAGVSLSILGLGAGASVASTTTSGDIAQSLVIFLEDRRVLYRDPHHEDASHADKSVLQIRKELTEALQQIDLADPGALSLREMRDACHAFSNRSPEDHWHRHLDELRTKFGSALAQLDKLYGLEMEPKLRRILREPGVG